MCVSSCVKICSISAALPAGRRLLQTTTESGVGPMTKARALDSAPRFWQGRHWRESHSVLVVAVGFELVLLLLFSSLRADVAICGEDGDAVMLLVVLVVGPAPVPQGRDDDVSRRKRPRTPSACSSSSSVLGSASKMRRRVRFPSRFLRTLRRGNHHLEAVFAGAPGHSRLCLLLLASCSAASAPVWSRPRAP